jgi:SAM-dependent methyltransferase
LKDELFLSHRDLEDRHWWFRARRRAIHDLGTWLLAPGGQVVDVGCGTGGDIAAFPDRYERHGIDPSTTAIEYARSAHPGVSFQIGAFPGTGGHLIGAADLVLLCDVLEHIEDDTGFLRALLSSMRPGAHLLLMVPADPRLWSTHDEVYGHYRRYTRDTLVSAWSGSPVEVRLLAPLNRRLYPLVRLARAVSGLRGGGWGCESSDLVLPWAPVNTVLERIFAGEVPALAAALRSGSVESSGRGVSLVAVLRRVERV